jgi:tungstate transport system ATP-binding protein
MPPLLELTDIVVRRGRDTTLAVDRLDVEAGEVLAVIGPNGAGKTTLLQVAAALLSPASGEVRFEGRAVQDDPLAYRRRLAVVMQEALLIDGTVLDNVALGMKLRGVGRAERRQRALAWLGRFGIAALAGRPARRISGGEAQRASLARAFAIEPRLLLLDEPFSGLDQPTRTALTADLAAVLRETGTTAIFVSHDREEAMQLADRVAVVLDGRLRQVGPTQSVFGAPVDEEVATFVEIENILPGKVAGRAGGLVDVRVGDQLIAAAVDGDLPDAVRVCLRPDDVTLELLSEGSVAGSARNHLAGRVQDVRLLGSRARVVVDCGFPIVVTVTARSVADLDLQPGTAVMAIFKATAIHLLPGAR